MPAIEARHKDLLDETRLAMLGTQLLMGLQYNAEFSQRFGSLPLPCRWLDGIALLLILMTGALLLAVPAYHQIAEEGQATARMLARASDGLKGALLPLCWRWGWMSPLRSMQSLGLGHRASLARRSCSRRCSCGSRYRCGAPRASGGGHGG
jgi:hypothetical protein